MGETTQVSDAAVEAVARVLAGSTWDRLGEEGRQRGRSTAGRVLQAALPALRDSILDELKERLLSDETCFKAYTVAVGHLLPEHKPAAIREARAFIEAALSTLTETDHE